MTSEITINGVTKIFPTRSEPIIALDRFDLTLTAGQVTCLLGPSGCGKTTVLRMIAGFEDVTSGSIMVEDEEVRIIDPERAVVFQQPALFPWLTVLDNVMAPSRAQGLDRQVNHTRAEQLLDAMALSSFTKSFPYELSGGMRQRVQIARALLCKPKILLMDEPFGALDAQTRLELQQLFLDICEAEHPTVLFVTHDIDEAVLLGDRVVIMSPRPGRVKETLPVSLPRPRGYHSLTDESFVSVKERLLDTIYGQDATNPAPQKLEGSVL